MAQGPQHTWPCPLSLPRVCSLWQGQAALCISCGKWVGCSRTTGHPWWPRDIPVPRASSQHHGRFSLPVFLPGNCPFSHFLGAGQPVGCGMRLPPTSCLLSTAGLGAVGPAGTSAWGWKGLRQAKENKSAAGPGWLTSQTTVFDSLLLPCQVQLLPHSHPLAAGARGDAGSLRSGGEGGCRGEQQREGLALHCFLSALLSPIPLPGEGQGVMLPGV